MIQLYQPGNTTRSSSLELAVCSEGQREFRLQRLRNDWDFYGMLLRASVLPREHKQIHTVKVSVYLNQQVYLSPPSARLPAGSGLVDPITTQKPLWVPLMGLDYLPEPQVAACLQPRPSSDSPGQVATEQKMQLRPPARCPRPIGAEQTNRSTE